MKTRPTSFQPPAYVSLRAHSHRLAATSARLCSACPYARPLPYLAAVAPSGPTFAQR